MATPDASRPLSALGARVGDAAAALSEAERTALRLRDRDGAPYERIAEAAGVDVEGVPDLLVGARLAVREAVRDVDSPPERTPECREARRRLTRRQDGEALEAGDAAALEDHLASCDACRLARRALREGALAAQAWDGVVPEDPHRGGTVLDEEDFGGLPDFVPGPPAPPRGRERSEARAVVPRGREHAEARPAGAGSRPPRRRSALTGSLAAGAIAAGVAAVALVVVNVETPTSAGTGEAAATPAATTEPVALQRPQLTKQERLDRRRAAARRAARREARRLAPLHAERRREVLARRAAAAARRRSRAAARRRSEAAARRRSRAAARRRSAAGQPAAPKRSPAPTSKPRAKARLEPVRTPAPEPVATATPAPARSPRPAPTPQPTATVAPTTTPAATATPTPE